uniref:Uncharacterized protein n=1 Tax=viral metagenome TaxID=1070528 RepID=A0A6C0ED71_9ZZZZ
MNEYFPLQSYIIKNTFIDIDSPIIDNLRRSKSCISFTYNPQCSDLIIDKKSTDYLSTKNKNTYIGLNNSINIKNKKINKKDDFDDIIKEQILINEQTLQNIANINKINEFLSFQTMKPIDILIKKIQEYILSDIIVKINNVVYGWTDYLKLKYKKKICLIINNAKKQLDIYYNLIKYHIKYWININYDNLLDKKNHISEIKNYLKNNLSLIKINDKIFNEYIDILIIYDDIIL